tara:strand:+ start:114 stop:455 length:342 start_codon:yes stop_codon:yes gene_type:complete
MSRKLIILCCIFFLYSCSYSIEPQYKEFIKERESKGKYDVSESTDINLCRLQAMTSGRLIAKQIRIKISQSVDKEIERRNLDCEKPFPQKEEKYSVTDEDSDLFEWLQGLIKD